MKNSILLIIFLLGAFEFGISQKVQVRISPQWGLEIFKNSTSYAMSGYSVKVTRLQYYLSKVAIHYDGGKVHKFDGLYFLVTANRDTNLVLGNVDLPNIEKIELGLGVDQDVNHLDPSIYVPAHPLALKSPSMHWGWTSGYRFIALEGNSDGGTGTFNKNFQIHTVEDVNYRTVAINVVPEKIQDITTIYLKADYRNLTDNINMKNGVISHSGSGVSTTIMDNFSSKVFSNNFVSSIQDIEFKGAVQIIQLNELSNLLQIINPNVQVNEVCIMSLNGQTLLQRSLNSDREEIEIESNANKYVYVQLRSNNKTVYSKLHFLK